MTRPLVVQTEELEPAPAAWLAERCELVVCPHTDAARLEALLARAEGLIVRTYTKVNAALLAKAPKLRVVGRAGIGLDNIDLEACRARGVTVVHTPGANTRAVVEFVTALIMDALRPRMFLEAPVEPARWHALRKELMANRQLGGLTLGIYGLGRVGSGVARIGAALDMRVIYNDLLDFPPARRFGATPVDRDALLRESDVLTVHVDDRPSNRHLLDSRAFSLLKKEAVFINTSRGFVVDPVALAEFLRANRAALAMVDVHDPYEPFDASYPLVGIPNAHLYPHIAAGTVAAKTNMSWVVRDVWRVLSGETPEWAARPPA